MIERRTVLKGGALLALSSILPLRLSGEAGAQSVKFVDAVDQMQTFLIDHFSEKNYRSVDALPVVTGRSTLNGGLRGWAWEALKEPGDMVVQVCAKLDDIHDRHRPDILPVFHVYQSHRKIGDTAADAFSHQLEFMLEAMKLDRKRFTFISTALFEPLRPIVERHDIDWDRQVLLRDQEEARAAGDGSGFIRIETPDGPVEAATVGFHYWLGDSPAPRVVDNPPGKGWTEVGEAVLDESFDVAFVIGVERLILALTGAYPTWDEHVDHLVRHVESSGDNDALATLRHYRTR